MATHVVVDGSNIATEGRSMPSLKQLNEAVLAFMEENPDAQVTVVVDATFGHRIDDAERAEFEEAEAHGELTSPPAGAIGRGDAFVLRIAEKVGALVLSNDSFQEFHGEHEWLFDKGRLIGGKPVPGVGWIFTPRTPVRGPKSREAVKEAKRTRVRVGSKDALAPMPVPKAPPPAKKAAAEVAVVAPKGRRGKALERAIADAVEEAVEPEEAASRGRGRRRKRKSEPPSSPINDPATFLSFVSTYQPGSDLEGVVESFASHGAFVLVDGARCYVPLSAMGSPPPRAAREVLNRGETRTFVVQAFDAPRRGIELALPGFAHPSGTPTEETVEAEITEADAVPVDAPKPARRSRKKAAPEFVEEAPAVAAEVVEAPAPAKRTRKKAAAEPVEAAPTPAKRTRKKAAASVVEAEPVAAEAPAPAKRTRKKAAAPVVEAAPVETPAPAKRIRKKAAAPVVEVAPVAAEAPAPAKRTRKKAAAPVVEAAPVETPAPAKRTRKKAAEPAEAPPAPAKRTTRKKKAAGETAEAAPAPAKRTRKKAAAPPT